MALPGMQGYVVINYDGKSSQIIPRDKLDETVWDFCNLRAMFIIETGIPVKSFPEGDEG